MTTTDLDSLRDRLHRLGFFGLISSWNDGAGEQWLPRLVEIEDKVRKKRSLDRRLRNARIALRTNGILAVWSCGDYDTFSERLERAGFDIEGCRGRKRPAQRRSPHVIWLATPNDAYEAYDARR